MIGIAVLLLSQEPSLAHEGRGIINVEPAEPTAAGSVRYVLRLVWENDQHAALNATVTATPIAPTGATSTPVVLTASDQDGRYQGVVTFPTSGSWTVRFTAVTPVASTEVTQEVQLPTASTTTVVGPATTTAEPVVPSPAGQQAATDSADDSGPPLALLGAVLVVLLVGAGALFRRRPPA